jgi:hypothetical protein
MVTIVVMLLSWGVTDAKAQQWVAITACDSVLIEGVFYPRVSFEIQDPPTGAAIEIVIATQIVSTDPGDTCRVVRAAGPEYWDPQIGTTTTGATCVLWGRWGGDVAPTLLPGESLSGFQLVLTPGHSCCFEFEFTPMTSEPFAYENDCFECDRAVPVIGRTWGAMKALYR